MRWPRDAQLSLAARLRTLVVLGLVAAVVLETPLRGVSGMPAWLHLGGMSTATGSVLPSAGEPGAPVLAAAKKHKRDKQDQNPAGTHTRSKTDTPGKNNGDKQDQPAKDKPGKDKAGKKGKDKEGTGKNKAKGDAKGKKDKLKGGGKRKDKRAATGRSAAADVTIAAADGPLTMAPVADSQVNEANPNFDYGARARLLVDGGGDDPDVASYLRFDVSSLTAPVQRATLRLWVQANGGTQDGPEVRSTSTDWTESDITWTTRPAANGEVLDDTSRLTGSTWAEYDVTSAVRGDRPVAFVLLSQSNDGAIFDSREGEHGPELVIAIEDDTPPPSPEPGPTATTEPDPTAPPDVTPTPESMATATPEPTLTPEPTAPPSPPSGESATLLAAGDIAGCSSSGDEATAALLDGLAGTVATLGDNAYSSGTPLEFTTCYGPSWGRQLARTRPALGNHDYETSGASGYFGYFNPVVQTSYYSYELGSWHIVVLDSNCSKVGGCDVGSAQETWLRQDLAAHPTACTLAYWHHPRFSFGNYDNDTRTQALWQALDEAGAEIVLAGHDHNYQRWAPQTPSGTRDEARGIREFVVGTGGRSHYALGSPPANVETFNGDTFGILQLTLHPTSYDWVFVPEAGKTFTDTGSGTCH